jgi:hypothetical protein
MNLNRVRNRTTRPTRGSRSAFGVCLVAVLLAVVGLTASGAWAAAGGLPGTGDRSFSPGGSMDNHCIGPVGGVDANQLLGISEPLVPCVDAHVGEFYAMITGGWLMNSSWGTVPTDYTPSAPTPLQDFMSKVRSVIFVVDPGTKQQHSYRYAAQDIMDVHSLSDYLPGIAPDWPQVVFLAKLPPLPPGEHEVQQLLEVSAPLCDGLGTIPGFNCLPAGITSLTICPFRVLPRNDPASRP